MTSNETLTVRYWLKQQSLGFFGSLSDDFDWLVEEGKCTATEANNKMVKRKQLIQWLLTDKPENIEQLQSRSIRHIHKFLYELLGYSHDYLRSRYGIEAMQVPSLIAMIEGIIRYKQFKDPYDIALW